MSVAITSRVSHASGSVGQRCKIGTLLVAAIMLTGTAAVRFSPGKAEEAARPLPVSAPTGIGCLGTLEPKSRIVRLSAPASLDGARVEQLRVAEGEWVESRAVIAVLDTYQRLNAALIEANAEVAVAQARLEQIRAGSKAGEISAREADLDRAEAELRKAEAEFQRAEQLRSDQAVSQREFDQRQHEVEAARHEVERAAGLLASAREVRNVDVALAQAELDCVLASVERAESELETAQVRAPFAGRILKVVTRPGERIGESGIVELGDTSEMDAVAEVYEADVPRVCVGQTARIRVPSLDEQLRGEVVSIGHRVGRKIVLDNDPVADTDARVVEVRIRLDSEDGSRVAGLSNARVHVVIEAQ